MVSHTYSFDSIKFLPVLEIGTIQSIFQRYELPKAYQSPQLQPYEAQAGQEGLMLCPKGGLHAINIACEYCWEDERHLDLETNGAWKKEDKVDSRTHRRTERSLPGHLRYSLRNRTRHLTTNKSFSMGHRGCHKRPIKPITISTTFDINMLYKYLLIMRVPLPLRPLALLCND